MIEENVPEIFVDGLGKNRFTRGVVRLDLISSSLSDTDDPDMSSEVIHRLIMAPHGFAQMVYALNRLLHQLVEAGIVQQASGGSPQAITGVTKKKARTTRRKASPKKRK